MKYFVILIYFFIIGCEGFKINGAACESMQAAQVSTQCRNYNDEEATQANLPMYDENGKCLKCNKPEKVDVRQ